MLYIGKTQAINVFLCIRRFGGTISWRLGSS